MILKSLLGAILGIIVLLGSFFGVDAQGPTQPPPISIINNTEPISHVTWSPEYSWLASSSNNGSQISIWDVTTGNSINRLGISQEGQVNAMEWSPDGQFIASLHGNYRFQIWNTKNWENVLNFRLDFFLEQEFYVSYLTSLAWSPDSRQIALTVDYRLVIWELGSGFSYISEDEYSAISAKWSPDGSKLAILSPDGSIEILDGTSFASLTTIPRPEVVPIRLFYEPTSQILEWSPDSSQLAYFGNDFAVKDSMLIVLDASTGSAVSTKNFMDNNIWGIHWNPANAFLAVAGTDFTIQLWDTQTHQISEILKAHTDVVTSMDWSLNGNYLASASRDRTIRVWEIK